jgi:transposase
MGHPVIRLPPYHCQYNPIQLIWAKVKGKVTQLNNTFRLSDVERLMNEAIDRVTKDDWISRAEHTEKLQ